MWIKNWYNFQNNKLRILKFHSKPWSLTNCIVKNIAGFVQNWAFLTLDSLPPLPLISCSIICSHVAKMAMKPYYSSLSNLRSFENFPTFAKLNYIFLSI